MWPDLNEVDFFFPIINFIAFFITFGSLIGVVGLKCIKYFGKLIPFPFFNHLTKCNIKSKSVESFVDIYFLVLRMGLMRHNFQLFFIF